YRCSTVTPFIYFDNINASGEQSTFGSKSMMAYDMKFEKIAFKNGNTYEGEINEDLMHGNGIFVWSDGTVYEGQFKDGYPTGKGKMILPDLSVYEGNFCRGHFHGEGSLNVKYTSMIYNGLWKSGRKHGIMNFGSECGSKLAGSWRHNEKHGPGMVVCGNGRIIGCNPLFENDKPINHRSRISLSSITNISLNLDRLEMESRSENHEIFREIISLMTSKKACNAFDTVLLAKITRCGMNLPSNVFVKLIDSTSGSKKKWCPLDIPIHTVAEDVDLGYYIDKICDYFNMDIHGESPDQSQKGGSSLAEDVERNEFASVEENEDSISSDNKNSEDDYLFKIKKREAVLLKNYLTSNLPKLFNIYNTYATLAKKHPINFKPVLIRLFLWQLFRDLRLAQEGVSLVEADEFLYNNPASCVETLHYPFETIYFYQFVQSLVGFSWLLFLKKVEKGVAFTTGCIVKIFKEFLENTLYLYAGEIKGSVFTENLDVVPITAVYRLYLSVGEPVSVRAFINATCTKKYSDPPCYQNIRTGPEKNNPKNGYNAVPMGHEIYYVPDARSDASNVEPDEYSDTFKKTLHTFRTLGKKSILNCLTVVCPKIVNHHQNINWSYKLTFLEFYEVILLCNYAKAEEYRVSEEKSLREYQKANAERRSSFTSRPRTRETKRKKSIKSVLEIN
ncbi:hypothetical protein JTB14_032077, partial [Gonioctena quinquepunctata]